MRRREFLSHSIAWGLLGGASSGSCGCGTILHGERIGQPHSRDIDWGVAALNGLGLVLFFVPGVIAFAVDFYTGAIFLPPEAMEMPSVSQDPAADATVGICLPDKLGTAAFRRCRCFGRRATEFRVAGDPWTKPADLAQSGHCGSRVKSAIDRAQGRSAHRTPVRPGRLRRARESTGKPVSVCPAMPAPSR